MWSTMLYNECVCVVGADADAAASDNVQDYPHGGKIKWEIF